MIPPWKAFRLYLGTGGRIDGDAIHPALVALGIVVAIAIGWVIWEFWLQDKSK